MKEELWAFQEQALINATSELWTMCFQENEEKMMKEVFGQVVELVEGNYDTSTTKQIITKEKKLQQV